MTFWMNDHVDTDLLKIAAKTARRCRIFYGDLIDDYSEIEGFDSARFHQSCQYTEDSESVNDGLNDALWTIWNWNETADDWNDEDTPYWSPELAAELGKLDAACTFIEMIQADERVLN